MDDSLPIPEATTKRDGKYQDAARLYIHKRITNFAELARLVGLKSSIHLLRVKAEDRWDDFTAQVAASQITSVWSGLSSLDGWAPDAFVRVKEERDRQVAQIPFLREQVSALELALAEAEVGSKQYCSAVSSLKTLTSLLSDVTGLDRFWKALDAGAKKDNGMHHERATKGTILDV